MPYVPSVVRWPRGNYGRSDVFAGAGTGAHALPKSNAPTASQRNVEGADASPATRGVRDWGQDEEETRAKHHSPLRSQASCFGVEGVLLERSCCTARVAVGTRRHRPLALAKISKAAAAFFPALFYRSRVPFRAAFFSGPGSTSVSLRHSACKAHITSKHSPASKRLRKE